MNTSKREYNPPEIDELPMEGWIVADDTPVISKVNPNEDDPFA